MLGNTMKNTLYILCSIILISLTSLGQEDELNIDWQRITDKDFIVKFGQVEYDTTSQYAIDNRIKTLSIDDDAHIFSKLKVKQIKDLISDTTNFSEDDEDEVCKTTKFTKAIVVMHRDNLVGVIFIGCNGKLLVLEPRTNGKELILLNEKGIKLKDKILNEIKLSN